MAGVQATATDMSTQAWVTGTLFNLATSRTVPRVADLVNNRLCWSSVRRRGFQGRLRRGRVRSRLSEGSLGGIPKMFGVQLAVHLKPLLRGTLLVLLEVGNDVIEEGDEVVLEFTEAHNALGPCPQTRASFGGKSGAN